MKFIVCVYSISALLLAASQSPAWELSPPPEYPPIPKHILKIVNQEGELLDTECHSEIQVSIDPPISYHVQSAVFYWRSTDGSKAYSYEVVTDPDKWCMPYPVNETSLVRVTESDITGGEGFTYWENRALLRRMVEVIFWRIANPPDPA